MSNARTERFESEEPIARKIEDLVREIPGWSPADELFALFMLLYSTSGLRGDVVEIGAWCGRSSVVLGMAAAFAPGTNVFSIDLFPERNDWQKNTDGSYSIAVKIGGKTFTACVEQTVWAEPFERDIAPTYSGHDGTLGIFLKAVARHGLGHIVHPHRGTSTTFLQSTPNSLACKFAFIDGDHSYQAVCEDIRNIEKILLPGGWICFDDAFTINKGIDRAISELVLGSSNYELGQQLTRKLFVARKK